MKTLYNTRVHDDLILALRGCKIPDYKIFGFFNDLINRAVQSPPTYKKGDRIAWAFMQHGNQHEETFNTDFWVHRGYFPDTGIFFKMVLARNTETSYNPNTAEFFAKFEMKVRAMKSNIPRRGRRTPPPRENFRLVDSGYISDLITECEIFGHSTSEPLKVPQQRPMSLKVEGGKRVRTKKVKIPDDWS